MCYAWAAFSGFRVISGIMFNGRLAGNGAARERFSVALAGRPFTPAHADAEQGKRGAMEGAPFALR
ncbi:hypothetical protein, partial [Lonsdalea populi]|uniref:hypothetical protein n=1 Tax=Lonsdalea populi TaxID=1172565 RepID=UPI001C65B945